MKLAPILAAVLACAAIFAPQLADASPGRTQSTFCTSTTSCAFSSPPANGSVVVFVLNNAASSFSGVTITDSNSVALTQHLPSGNCTASMCSAIYDTITTGSPTATYTISGLTGLGGSGALGMFELSGTSTVGASYAAAIGPDSGGIINGDQMTGLISPAIGDVFLCMVGWTTSTALNAPSMGNQSFSGVGAPNTNIGSAIETASGGDFCRLVAASGSYALSVMALASYTNPPPPSSGSFQDAGGMTGDVIFERVLRLLCA